jgi:hypothetical protein
MALSQTISIFLESYSAPSELENFVDINPWLRQGLFICGSFRANFVENCKAFIKNQNAAILSDLQRCVYRLVAIGRWA